MTPSVTELLSTGRLQEAELTKRLADELTKLQDARRNDKPDDVEVCQRDVDATRREIEAFGGWVYGPGLKKYQKPAEGQTAQGQE